MEENAKSPGHPWTAWAFLFKISALFIVLAPLFDRLVQVMGGLPKQGVGIAQRLASAVDRQPGSVAVDYVPIRIKTAVG
jgi:hypothetical protein